MKMRRLLSVWLSLALLLGAGISLTTSTGTGSAAVKPNVVVIMTDDQNVDSLPVIQSCFRNFTKVTPDPDCVLDQETLSALVLAVDQAERAEGDDRNRIDLATLLQMGW